MMNAQVGWFLPGKNYCVIARPQAVAISWYCVENRTWFQEIATPFGLAMTC